MQIPRPRPEQHSCSHWKPQRWGSSPFLTIPLGTGGVKQPQISAGPGRPVRGAEPGSVVSGLEASSVQAGPAALLSAGERGRSRRHRLCQQSTRRAAPHQAALGCAQQLLNFVHLIELKCINLFLKANPHYNSHSGLLPRPQHPLAPQLIKHHPKRVDLPRARGADKLDSPPWPGSAPRPGLSTSTSREQPGGPVLLGPVPGHVHSAGAAWV